MYDIGWVVKFEGRSDCEHASFVAAVSWAFFEAVGTVYLGLAIGYLIWYLIIR